MPFFTVTSHGGRVKWTPWGLFYEDTNPIHEGLPPPNSLLQGPPSKYHHNGDLISTYKFGEGRGHKHKSITIFKFCLAHLYSFYLLIDVLLSVETSFFWVPFILCPWFTFFSLSVVKTVQLKSLSSNSNVRDTFC